MKLDDCFVEKDKEFFEGLKSTAQSIVELFSKSDLRSDRLAEEISKVRSLLIRAEIIGAVAREKKIPIDVLRNEVSKYLPDESKGETSQLETFTAEELEKAKIILQSPKILEQMIDLTTRRGYVGEAVNKIMLFLSFTSRLLNKSISGIVKGLSASGKNALVNSLGVFIPKEDFYVYSYMTAKALLYFPGDLSHKILFIQEHIGGQSADYAVRIAISEDEISVGLPVKDEATGEFTMDEKRIKAVGLVYITTTTREKIHNENQTRVFDLFMDESEEQTRKILDIQSEHQDEPISPELEAEAKNWRAAQTLLKGEKINIPFAKELTSLFPTDKVRVRRDFLRFLALIKAHAFLYQYQREKDNNGRLIATVEDLDGIAPIAEKVLTDTLKELTPKQEKVLDVIQDNFAESEFSLKELHGKTKDIVTHRTLQRYVEFFVKEGALEWNGEKARKSRYLLSIIRGVNDVNTSFGAKLQSILNKIKDLNDKADLTSNVVNVVKEEFDDIDASSRQNDLASINSNKDNELSRKNLFTTFTTRGNGEGDDLPNETDRDSKENGASSDSESQLLDFALKELPNDPYAYTLEGVTYATGEVVFRLEQRESDGSLTIHVITPDSPAYKEAKNEYERRTR